MGCFNTGSMNLGNGSDQYFNLARENLQQITRDLSNCTGINNVSQQYSSSEFLLSQLKAWENSNQNLHQQMTTVQSEQQQTLNTVFKFEADHFKMVVDIRGYQPTEIKLTITAIGIEITAGHEQTAKGSNVSGYAHRTITRLYEMPLQISPEKVICNLSPEGTLFITAPWLRNN